ncbi:hypothetical protein OnM2_037098 [Erysiphe neolycopersici]|uniref:Uncharacterized protein n=1 Tax=Erysiphe neolycopersici TaxID=212602 RepID=A0A420HWU5_9PEZI|nr:hypothetical protein OnM2_037098 [Erysiphe neolycopersici]
MACDDLPSGVDIIAALNGPTPLSCFVRVKPECSVSTPKALSKVSKVTQRTNLSTKDEPKRQMVTAETVFSDIQSGSKRTTRQVEDPPVVVNSTVKSHSAVQGRLPSKIK